MLSAPTMINWCAQKPPAPIEQVIYYLL